MTTKSNEARPYRVWMMFMLQVSLVVAVFVFGLYLGIYLRDKKLIQEQILTSARAHFQNIVLTRMWNAMHDGVYVEKKPGVETNPYLENPEITTRDGRIFTLRNPAMMTREISELADLHGVFKYRITSLKPLNPGNAPDDFERKALENFEHGEKESTVEETQGDTTLFRYMAPLETTEACLSCHAKQGYKVGDVRGGISVTFDITPIKQAMELNQNIILGLIVLSTAMVLGVFLFFAMRLMHQLQAAQKEIAQLAVTDELTGLANRRHFFDRFDEEVDRCNRYGNSLSLLMLDIDHFKQVNDTYGHPAGDAVLAEVARLLKANIRTSDIIARYGGEEFVVLIPSMTATEAAQAAEKLRVVIEVNDIALEGPPLNVTISAGVADIESVKDHDSSLKDALIRAADRALYKAKADGRNRVVVDEGDPS
ncbi:diguanylate cyclase [Pseudodesulfovibrio sp.]|nr:diguanylate cyclase [Pseudodesulfovibrio sp.]